MLKIKFKQYGIFKKIINSSIMNINRFFFINEAERVTFNKSKNKIKERDSWININNYKENLSENKSRTMFKNRRQENFLREDEELYRKKTEFKEKDNNPKQVNHIIEEDDNDSFLNYENLTKNDSNKSMIVSKLKDSQSKLSVTQEIIPLNEKNFKNLIVDTYKSTLFLNKLSPNEIDEYCLIFIKNIFTPESTPEKMIGIIQETFNNNYKNSKLSYDYKRGIAKNIFDCLLTIFEFMDRGMKGFLSGDLTYQFVKSSRDILESYLKEIEELEKNFINLGLDTKDFYDSFFKIDNKFYTNNSSKSLTFNYNLENSTFNSNSVYVINLKVTQFFDLVQKKINIKDKMNVKFEDVKNMIDREKHKFHNLFNDMYNNLFESTITNKLKTPYHGILYPSKENKHNLFRRQLILEDFAYESSIKKYKDNFINLTEISKTSDLMHARNLIITFHNDLKYYVCQTQKSIIKNKSFDDGKNNYLKYFITLKAEDISILCIMNMMECLNQKLKNKENNEKNKLNKIMYNEIEESDLEAKFPLIIFAEKLGNSFFKELRNSKINKTFDTDTAKIYFKNLNVNIYEFEVNKVEVIKMGTFLVNLMEKSMMFSNNIVESLKKSYNDQNFKTNHVLKVVQEMIDKTKRQNFVVFNKFFLGYYFLSLSKSFSMMIQIEKSLPMIYKPLKWKNLYIGSHYLRFTPLSKIENGNKDSIFSYNISNTSKVMQVLDNLGNLKWRINKKILDVIEFIWASGGDKAKIPKRFNDIVLTKEMLSNISPKEKYNLLKMAKENSDNHSKRSDFLIKLSIARDFSQINEIYYPHNIDYRGRAYPISPHLNHLGSDLSRGLLEYGESKPLGKNGLRWLKIHLANVIGKDKLPLDKREKYVDSIIDKVHKCAKDPYNNNEWLDSDNPFQTLATMIDVSDAILSGNPQNFKSHVHVHVDGSCNGLQHYSALGRDYKGGFEVNLVDRDRPGDVYTKVLDIVLSKLENERNPNLILFADLLKKAKCVNRKTIKQTVMTSVYGVTLVGARDQIEKQLNEFHVIDKEIISKVSMYLAQITIESIGDLFREANEIKTWLSKCALIISQSGNTVKWITPLGLPCIQPYKRITELDVIKTINWGVTIATSYKDQPVNERKQGSAFPPNYIHSLDSCHMMLTCLRAKKEGINFTSVHDSFWAHACDIDKLNKILREEFLNLYNQPLLENLLRDFKTSYPELKFPDLPDRGSLDLKEVLNSTYFFS